jgi:hypothetical protein
MMVLTMDVSPFSAYFPSLRSTCTTQQPLLKYAQIFRSDESSCLISIYNIGQNFKFTVSWAVMPCSLLHRDRRYQTTHS